MAKPQRRNRFRQSMIVNFTRQTD